MLRGTRSSLGVLAVVLAGACGGTAMNARVAAPGAMTPVATARSCARVHAASSSPVPLASPRAGSTVALATYQGKTLAYAADEDDWAVHVVDVDAAKELGAVPLAGRPSQLLFLPDGRLVVLLRDLSQARVLEPGSAPEQLEERCSVDTPPEPVALALTPDDATVLVTSGWGRALTAFDASKLDRSFQVALPREPRAVVVSDDGKSAYVSHAVGARASRVDLATRAVEDVPLRARDLQHTFLRRTLHAQAETFRKANQVVPEHVAHAIEEAEHGSPSCQGYALAKSVAPGGRILAPQVLVENGDPKQRATGYGNDTTATEVPDVAVIDAVTGKPIGSSLERTQELGVWGGFDPRTRVRPECLLPRAAAVDPKGKSLLVACYGIDEVVAYDALAASPARAERRRWSVAAGPSGIAVDPEKNRAVVWSQFNRAVQVLDLGSGELVDDEAHPAPKPARIAMAPSATRALPVAAALGRLLFHAVGDARISKDGRACASCHPDGRDDALVWATPDGPRRSIMLAGRVKETAPYSWGGSKSDLKEHLTATFDRLNGAGGLKSVELDALVAYVESLAPPPPLAPALDAASPKVARGAALFASDDVGCSGCHEGALATDNGHHDVKSKTAVDRSGKFNTPTLHLVGGTGPYFHDGRYATLHELLTANQDAMGHTAQLSAADVDALESYLRTL